MERTCRYDRPVVDFESIIHHFAGCLDFLETFVFAIPLPLKGICASETYHIGKLHISRVLNLFLS